MSKINVKKRINNYVLATPQSLGFLLGYTPSLFYLLFLCLRRGVCVLKNAAWDTVKLTQGIYTNIRIHIFVHIIIK